MVEAGKVGAGVGITGCAVVFVTLPTGVRYAFIGDLTWQLDGITRRVQRAVAGEQAH